MGKFSVSFPLWTTTERKGRFLALVQIENSVHTSAEVLSGPGNFRQQVAVIILLWCDELDIDVPRAEGKQSWGFGSGNKNTLILDSWAVCSLILLCGEELELRVCGLSAIVCVQLCERERVSNPFPQGLQVDA